jgi:hypothetical protein
MIRNLAFQRIGGENRLASNAEDGSYVEVFERQKL